MNNFSNKYLSHEAVIVDYVKESWDIFTLKLQFTDPTIREQYEFEPGQFNLLYLFGAGEVAISIVSDPEDKDIFSHTIRTVGSVTNGMVKLKVGDRIGVRGPFGRGWPLKEAKNKDVVIVSGGIGCAPVSSAINFILQRRSQFKSLKILQGVKCSAEHIYCERYDKWAKAPGTEVIISADIEEPNWEGAIGFVTEHIKPLSLDPDATVVMMCGPEIMMQIAAKYLLNKNIPEQNIYLSMERNMQCGIGHCGHCQIGGSFVCKDGPVFSYDQIKELLGVRGF